MENYKQLSPENAHLLIKPSAQEIKKSPSLSLNDKAIQLMSEGKKIYRFGFGKNPFSIPEVLVQKFVEESKGAEYLDANGLKDLRHHIAQWFNKAEKLSFTQEDILIGPGSKELMFLIGNVLNCQAIVSTPCYVSVIPQVQFLKKDIRLVHTKFENKWKMTPEELDQVCQRDINDPKRRNKYVIMNYPNNPAGTTYNAQELKELAKVARKHNLIIVADQIYANFHYKGEHESLARYYPEGTIISSSMSKWVSGSGWRLGFFAFPKELRWIRDSMNKISSEIYSAFSASIKSASCFAFLEGEEVTEHLKLQRILLQFIGVWCYEKLTKESNILTIRPEAGVYIFLDFENYRSRLVKKGVKISKDLGDLLTQEAGISLLSGESCGREEAQLTFRLSFVNYDGGEAMKAYREGAQLNENFLRKYCTETIEGIEALIKWLKELSE